MALTITSNRNAEISLNHSDTGDSPLTIDAGVTVSAGSGSYAVYTSYYQSWSITNLGTLLGKYGVLLNDANTRPGSVLTNSGTAALISGSKIGVEVFGSYSTVTNQGTILGGSGDGVDLDATDDTVTNSGTAALIQGGTDGIYAGPSAAVVTNFGTITGVSGDGVSLKGGGTVTNSTASARITGGTDGVYATTIAAAVGNAGTIIGTSGDGVYLNAGGRVTNSSTAALISGGGNYGVRVNGAAGTVTNLGTMTGAVAAVDFLNGGTLANNGTAARILGGDWGGYFGASGGAVTITNQGTIVGTSVAGINLGDGGRVTNSGTAALISGGEFGIAAGSAATVSNQGSIVGTGNYGLRLGDGGAVTNSAGALISGGFDAIYSQSGGALSLTNQGRITGGSGGLFGVNMQDGGVVLNTATEASIAGEAGGVWAQNVAATVSNQGTIVGTTGQGVYLGAGGAVTNSTGAQIDGAAYGVLASNTAIGVVNQGSIVGTTKVGVYLNDGGTVSNNGTGALISGDFGIKVKGGAGTVTNQGSAVGATSAGVYLGDGGTVTNSTTGQLDGHVNGVVGFSVAIGVVNQGSITGTTKAGVYLGSGGTVTNSGTAARISGALFGVDVHSGPATIIDQGTLSGTTDAVEFDGASGNLLELYPGAKLVGVANGVSGTALLALASGASAGIISGIGSQYKGFGAFDVGAGADWTMSGSNTIAAFATLSLGAAATLTVSGSLVSLGHPTLEGSGTIAMSGTGAIEVGTGAIATAGQFAIDAGLTVVTDGSVSLGDVLNEGTVTGLASYGIYLGAGGRVSNSRVGRISGQNDGIAANGAATVGNQGTITGANNEGVHLGDGGSVTNSGTGALISGYDAGVFSNLGPATVVNSGRITTTAGESGAAVNLKDGGTVTNQSSGTISSGSLDGVYIFGGVGTVVNAGQISAGFRGVYLGTGGTVTNQGTVSGVNYGINVRNGVAVVTNSGTITSEFGKAVGLAANYANTLAISPGASFSGVVDGGNTVGDGVTSTLELKTGASAGTLAGLGSQYVNFALTTIDANASWTLTGYNSLASGATLTNSGTLALSSATLTGSFVLINNGGITLDPSTLTVGTLLGTGVVTVGAGGMLNAQGTVAGGETIAFAGDNANLHLDAPDSVSGSVSNLGLGDLIDLQGIAPGSVQFSAGTLSFSGGSFALSLNGTPEVQAVPSADGTLFEVVGPVISGTASDQPVTDATTIDPFSAVAITDANAGQTETVTVTLSDAANGTLSDLGTGNLNDGVYADTGTAAQVTTALHGLVFTPAVDTGPLGHTVTTTFTIQATDTAGAIATDSTTSVVASAVPTPITLATFTGTGNGADPLGGLIADTAGDLFGTTSKGAADSDGTVFEIAKSGGVFASTPSTLVTFDGGDGASPQAGLITDAAGDLLGTTAGGGADGAGTVFEITLSSGVYSDSPTTLATFADTNNIGYRPVSGVLADGAGDLFGTVRFPSGANDGAVFEIANGTTTVTQVVGFTGGDDGGEPEGALIADPAGDLFGTTNVGGAGNDGTVFEIVNDITSYATTATTLVTFNLAGSGNGANPLGGLITDANGDLFGTTSSGGAHVDGTVFEIVKTGVNTYATTPTTLATFNGTGNGANPADTLIADANGDLFGTTQNGGANGDGTVFEIAKTGANTYATPTTLVTFNGTGNGANPYAGLLADTAGDLFGTTQNGGADSDGTAFEVVSTGATFAPVITGTAANQAVTDATTIDPFAAVTLTDGNSGQTETVTVTLSNAANGTLSSLANGNFAAGVYTDTGTAAQITGALDGLVFTPTDHQVPPGQTVTTTFTIQDTDTAGATATDSTTSVVATAICFCAGTLIATPAGDVRVENLAPGDHVLTSRGEARRIVWIGSGKVMVARGRRSAATPVIVRKGALAENVPHRDLHVTKGHSFYLDDVLIPAEFLVNHRSILWDDWAQQVTIYHVELETHDILLANGAPAESYRDDGNRWLFHNGNSGWDQPAKPPCAPVLTDGPVVDAVWRRLLDRAGPRPGLPLTDDPDLHLLVDGERLDAAIRQGAYVFRLPPPPASVRIVSRTGAPAELGLARDPRVLGVAVKWIALLQGTKFRVIEARDASLAEGFHAFEPDGDLRWTNGDAALPATLFEGFKGATELVLHVACTAQYVLREDARPVAA